MSEKAISVTRKYIENLTPARVIQDPSIGSQLVAKFSEMYNVAPAEANRFYQREKDNFSKLVSQSTDLAKCTPMSIYMAFGRVMQLKLSFENGRQPLVYLIPGNRNVGSKEKPQWVKEVVAQPSPAGEKEIRLSQGILKKIGQPIIVHEGDLFREFTDANGEVRVEWEKRGDSKKIIASFIRLVEPDGTVVFKVFRETHWERWMKASAKKNKGTANELYTSGHDGKIDEGFLEGKTLLHSFKGYKQIDVTYRSEGFVPDTNAAKEINSSFTEFEETDEVVEDAEVVPDALEEDLAKEEVKPAVVVDTKANKDDDIFD